MNDPLYLFDSLLNDNFWNDSLDNLRDLDYFLNHSRNNHNLLHDFFNFDNFGNFHHFLNDLFNRDFDFSDTINMSEYLHNFFLDVFDWFWYFDVMINNPLDLNYFWLSDDDRVSDFYDNWHLPLDYLDARLLNNFLHFYNPLMNDWNFNNSLHLLGNFFVNLYYSCDDFFYLFDSVHRHYFFNNDFHRIRPINSVSHSHYFLNDLRNFYYSFFSLDYDNGSFNNPINYNIPHFNVVFNLFCSDYFDLFHYLFYNFFNFHNFWDSNNLFNDFFNINWHLNYFLNYLLDRNYLFLVYDNFLDFNFNMIDNLSDYDRLLDLNYFLNYSFNGMHFGYLSDNFDNSILDCWDFNCFLDYPFQWNNFFLIGIHYNWNFDWYWNSLFNFHDFFNLYNLFNDFLHNNDLRNLNDPFDYFLNNFLNLNNFGHDPEDFENIINIDDIQNFLVNHSDDSFINFKSDACSSANFFKFLQKGFD